MEKKIEEARAEFNGILEFIIRAALGRQIHDVEEDIYRRLLRLGRILLELFVLANGTGKTGPCSGTCVSQVVRTCPSSERSRLCGLTMPKKEKRVSSR